MTGVRVISLTHDLRPKGGREMDRAMAKGTSISAANALPTYANQ